MAKVAYIVRGISGSGKTTFAESIPGVNKIICTADDYFMVDGQYKFDSSKLKEAHAWCLERFKKALSAGIETVIAANTFTQEWEFANYMSAAREAGYMVFSLIVENRNDTKNVHAVPDEVLDKQRARFSVKL